MISALRIFNDPDRKPNISKVTSSYSQIKPLKDYFFYNNFMKLQLRKKDRGMKVQLIGENRYFSAREFRYGYLRNILRPCYFLIIFCLIILLASCAMTSSQQQDIDYSLNQDEVRELNEKILAQAQINHDPSEYLLGSGDLLQIKVFEAEELTSSVRVSSRGFVTLPLIGQIMIKGLTAREAEQKIEDKYRERYIKDPHVSIFVEEHFSQRITLVGQFKNPGTYDYLSKQRLLDVIALGGGLSEKAGQIVQIRRGDNGQEKREVYIVDLDHLIKQGNEQLNIKINGGDVIFVPEAGVFFVDGAVRRPGSYPIKHRTIVQEALMEAGGLSPYANKESLQLVRVIDGKRQIIKLDLSKVESKELVVMDRDILIVDSSAMGKLFHGFNIFLGIPGTGGVGYRNPEN